MCQHPAKRGRPTMQSNWRIVLSILAALVALPAWAQAPAAATGPVYGVTYFEALPAAANAVVVVTHVDVPPPSKDECIGLLKQLTEMSRKDPGVLRFDVLQQDSRPNHFTVVEAWRDGKAQDAHIAAEHTREFRRKLTPLAGALFDERVYRTIR